MRFMNMEHKYKIVEPPFRTGAFLAGTMGCLFFFAFLTAGCCRTQCASELHCARNIVYGAGYVAEEEGDTPCLQPLLMDIMEPEDGGESSRPAVIIIHGGGFVQGSKEDEDQIEVASHLARNGYVCFLINYRLMNDHPPVPPSITDPLVRGGHAATVDAKAAHRHVCALASEYRIDPKRIALMGSSAGAATALAAGLSPPDRFYSDGEAFPVPPENHPEVETHTAAIINLWGSGDYFPELFTPEAPPIMTVHGGQDFRVGEGLQPAMNIDAWCRENGTVHVFYPVPEAGHGAWDAVIDGNSLAERITEFLDAYLHPLNKYFPGYPSLRKWWKESVRRPHAHP